jgi:uncharacterized membrane protein
MTTKKDMTGTTGTGITTNPGIITSLETMITMIIILGIIQNPNQTQNQFPTLNHSHSLESN